MFDPIVSENLLLDLNNLLVPSLPNYQSQGTETHIFSNDFYLEPVTTIGEETLHNLLTPPVIPSPVNRSGDILTGATDFQPEFINLPSLDNIIDNVTNLIENIGDFLSEPNLDNIFNLAPRFEDLIPNFFNDGKFDTRTGYGLINAAAAVAVAAFGDISLPFWNINDLGGNEWANDLVRAPEVWTGSLLTGTITGEGVVVAVIDDGVNIHHPDLQNNIWQNPGEIPGNGIDDDKNGFTDDIHGWNFTTDPDGNHGNILPASSRDTHGTHIAGTIAAQRNNLGSTGVAPNAKIMPIKIADTSTNGNWGNVGDIARAIRYAVDNGADVINMSFGSRGFSQEVRDALEYAAHHNVVTVAAAGNSAGTMPAFPANQAISWGISVGAVDRSSTLSHFSNLAGNNSGLLHVLAPGESIHSLGLGESYRLSSGTSMATPHVAGVVALMRSANPDLSVNDIRRIIAQTAIQIA